MPADAGASNMKQTKSTAAAAAHKHFSARADLYKTGQTIGESLVDKSFHEQGSSP